jgi:hypothetical protein
MLCIVRLPFATQPEGRQRQGFYCCTSFMNRVGEVDSSCCPAPPSPDRGCAEMVGQVLEARHCQSSSVY